MPLQDTPSRLEAAFVQRNNTNTFYEQVNISGSDLIVYFDSTGVLTADKISVWANLYNLTGSGSGSGVISGGSYNISASYASSSLSASYAITAAYASNAGSGVTPGGSYNISASYALSASYARSSSFAITSSHLVGNAYVSNSLYFERIAEPATHTEGRVYYDTAEGALSVMGLNNTILQVGQEMYIHVHNKTGTTISNGQVVALAGTATGFRPDIKLAIANGDNETAVIGVATHDIAHGDDGYITAFGSVHDLNTNAYNEGDALFLSTTTSGSYTSTHPVYPHAVYRIGTVLKQHINQGIIQVLIDSHVADWASTSSLALTSSYITSSNIAGIIPSASYALSASYTATSSLTVTSADYALLAGTAIRVVSPVLTTTGSIILLDNTYNTIFCNASTSSIEIRIPSAIGTPGVGFTIKKIDTTGNYVTVTGSQTIDNSANQIITKPYTAMSIISDGNEWWII